MSRQQKALKDLLSSAQGGERAVTAIFEEHADSAEARGAIRQMRRDITAQQEELSLWFDLEIQTELKRAHAQIPGWTLFGHCNHHGQKGGRAMQHKCWCCCVVGTQSWGQVCEVSYPGTEDSCFECFTALTAIHERHIVKYSMSRLLGVVKRMYSLECELTEDLVREKIRRIREVEDEESGSAAAERRPAESSERSSSRKRDQDGNVIEGDSIANAQAQRGMIINHLKDCLKKNPARPAEKLQAGDRGIGDWRNRKYDEFEDYETRDNATEGAVLTPASEVRHHSPERYGTDHENKYVRKRETGPGWWYEDESKQQKKKQKDNSRGVERYRDGGEYTWRGSLRERTESSTRPKQYTDDDSYGEWRGNRFVQGGWGVSHDRAGAYPLTNYRKTDARTTHEWGRRGAAQYDTGASRDYGGWDYDGHRRW